MLRWWAPESLGKSEVGLWDMFCRDTQQSAIADLPGFYYGIADLCRSTFPRSVKTKWPAQNPLTCSPSQCPTHTFLLNTELARH